MAKRFCALFEAALGAIADGLSRPRAEKRLTKLWKRIGRLKEKSHGIGQHYHIELQADASGKIATALTGLNKRPKAASSPIPASTACAAMRPPGMEEKWWRTCLMLTDLEAVFRSLKSELGLRPVFHHKEERADGRALPVRKATRAEPEQLAIYRALNLDSAPGGGRKIIV